MEPKSDIHFLYHHCNMNAMRTANIHYIFILKNLCSASSAGGQASVVIDYDSRIKSDMSFGKAAGVFAVNGIKVWL